MDPKLGFFLDLKLGGFPKTKQTENSYNSYILELVWSTYSHRINIWYIYLYIYI